MKTTALLVQSQSYDTTVADAIAAFEGTELHAFPDAKGALEWLVAESPTVDLAVLSGDLAFLEPLVAALVADKVAPPHLYLLAGAEEEALLRQVKSLNECVDALLVKPFFVDELKARIARQAILSAWRSSALIVTLGPEGEKGLPQWLGSLGFQKFYSVSDTDEAHGALKSKAKELALVIVDTPDLIRDAPRLVPFQRAARLSGAGVLIQAPREAVERVAAHQATEGNLAGFLTPSRDPRALREALEKVFAKLGKRAGVLRFLEEARHFEAKGSLAHAVAILQHATRNFPDLACLGEALGDVLKKSGEVSGAAAESKARAIEAFEGALKLEPWKESLHAKVMRAYEQTGRRIDLLRLLKQRLVRYGFDEAARVRLAAAYLEGGDAGAASIELRRVLNLNPHHDEARGRLKAIGVG